MGIIRDSFVIFKTWADAINALPEEYQLETYKALAEYGISGSIPEGLSAVAHAMLISFSRGMENSVARYTASVANGKRGGRPPKKTSEKKLNQDEPSSNLGLQTETQQNLEKPNQTQKNQNEPNNNLNVNDNVNVNEDVNENDIKLVKNIFNNNYLESLGRVRARSEKERKPFVEFFKGYFEWCFSDEYREYGYEIIDTIIEAKEQAAVGLKFGHKTLSKQDLGKIIKRIDADQFRSIVTQLRANKEIKNRPYYILGCLTNAGGSTAPGAG